MAAWVLIGSFLLLSIAFVTDIHNMRIPNWLTYTFAPLGVLLHGIETGISGVSYAALGLAAGFFPLLLVYALGGIGAGDVKLFGAAGAWLGSSAVVELTLYSFLYGAAGGAAFLLIRYIYRSFRGQSGSLSMLPLLYLRPAQLISALINVKTRRKPPGTAHRGTPIRFPFMAAVLPGALTLLLTH